MRERTPFQHGIRAGLFVLAASALALAVYVGWPRPDPYVAAPPLFIPVMNEPQCREGYHAETVTRPDGVMGITCTPDTP